MSTILGISLAADGYVPIHNTTDRWRKSVIACSSPEQARAGTTGSFDANQTPDVCLIRTDAAGNLLWQKTFNWSASLTMCTASSVERTSDGGYLLGGSACPGTMKDVYLIKTDKDGNR
jgi:hypothetical protein